MNQESQITQFLRSMEWDSSDEERSHLLTKFVGGDVNCFLLLDPRFESSNQSGLHLFFNDY